MIEIPDDRITETKLEWSWLGADEVEADNMWSGPQSLASARRTQAQIELRYGDALPLRWRARLTVTVWSDAFLWRQTPDGRPWPMIGTWHFTGKWIEQTGLPPE